MAVLNLNLLLLSVLAATNTLGAALTSRAAAAEPVDISARDVTTFRICKDIYFQNCANWKDVTTGVCYDFTSSDWNDKLSSAHSAAGFKCYIYKDWGCTGGEGGPITLNNDHRDLRQFGWNDITSSFRCWRS
ncbi:hypothetical protein BU26DRAFT_569982 [Trematosphaeria pertusa]|uniref:Uncharacterized protein n=1 Tax=Trematosphaeria pertusa TaxID=390896 RepID=A0A6A6HYY0_9PLEO|nr:uncharacterized protein BU26DRAFT_569982 [Trematosphaeria pertusa]KAF2243281.1 hypothetical protein BU26DRAFT_569982 [Trematosphaeria pertusa]